MLGLFKVFIHCCIKTLYLVVLIQFDNHNSEYTIFLQIGLFVANIFSDIGQGFSDGLSDAGLQEVISAAKDAVNETYNTLNQAGVAIGGAQVVLNVATTGLLVPVSDSEVESANTYINSYTSSGNNVVTSVTAGLQAP